MNETVFKDFEEYWSYAKLLTINQREIILSSLTTKQRKNLIYSYHNGGWEDLVMRNEIDMLVDAVEKEFNINLIYYRCKIMSGKSIPIRKIDWDHICSLFKKYKKGHTKHIFGNMRVEKLDSENILLVKI